MDADSLTVPRFIWVLVSAALLVSTAAGLSYLARQSPYVVRLERVEEPPPKTMDRVVKTEPIGPAQPLVPPITTTQETVSVPTSKPKAKAKPSKTRELLQKKWGR